MMLDWVRYRYEMSRLQRQKRRTARSYDKQWKDAKAQNKTEDDLEAYPYDTKP